MPNSAPKNRRWVPFPEAVYTTEFGVCLQGDSEKVITDTLLPGLKGQVDHIFTSPPFPLNRKKKYGNLKGAEYSTWLAKFGKLFSELLTPTGSIVIEMGNA